MNKKTFLVFVPIAVAMYFSVMYVLNIRGDTKVHVIAEEPVVKPIGTVYKVVLTADGFQPEEIDIVFGEIVEWTTTRDQFFWPASDLHPTHLLYSAFDPQEPIGKEETWGFRFDKEGEWKYHDHLAPYFTGTVRVRAAQ